MFCFCGDKWRKRKEKRRRFDKSGEYQRVDSVSSIVDNRGDHEDMYEGHEESGLYQPSSSIVLNVNPEQPSTSSDYYVKQQYLSTIEEQEFCTGM